MVRLDFGPKSFLRDFAFSFVRSALSLLRRLSGESVELSDVHRLIDSCLSEDNTFAVGFVSVDSDPDTALEEIKKNEVS